MLNPYPCSSIELIDCIPLSLLALNAILLTSSVNTLYFSLLNLCCDFNINLLLEILRFSLRLSTSNLPFPVGLLCFQV